MSPPRAHSPPGNPARFRCLDRVPLTQGSDGLLWNATSSCGRSPGWGPWSCPHHFRWQPAQGQSQGNRAQTPGRLRGSRAFGAVGQPHAGSWPQNGTGSHLGAKHHPIGVRMLTQTCRDCEVGDTFCPQTWCTGAPGPSSRDSSDCRAGLHSKQVACTGSTSQQRPRGREGRSPGEAS